MLYDYLLGMPIWSLTRERYEALLKTKGDKEELLNTLLQKSAKDLWNEDIAEFLIEWENFLEMDAENRKNAVTTESNNSSGTKRKRKTPVKKKDVGTAAKPKKNIVKKETPESKPTKIKSEPKVVELKKEVDNLSDFDSVLKKFSTSSQAFKAGSTTTSIEPSVTLSSASESPVSTSSSVTTKKSVTKKAALGKKVAPRKKTTSVILSDIDDDDTDGSEDFHGSDLSDEEIEVQVRPKRASRAKAKAPPKTYSLDSDEEMSDAVSESEDNYSE